MKIAKTRRRN